MRWQGARTLVTGGASFIGSHLVDALVERGASVRVVDNLSSGAIDNVRAHVDAGRVQLVQADLLEPGAADRAVRDIELAFHLAADHGGRGYLERHQSACASNLALDGLVFRACRDARVKKVVYASSACVYPLGLQADAAAPHPLAEDMVGPPFDADGMYGWAKLMGEMTLRAMVAEGGIEAASCRYFTVYGERSLESHAITAMIARAFVGQRPFIVWGTGEQVRNWTHVSDIVSGTLLAAERIHDGAAVNLGTTRSTRVIDAARAVLRLTGHQAEIVTQPDMPVGPLNRVADHSRATALLGWKPTVEFDDGLRRTIHWYFNVKNRDLVASQLATKLVER